VRFAFRLALVVLTVLSAQSAFARLPRRGFRSTDVRVRYGLDQNWLRYDRVAGAFVGGWVGVDNIGVPRSESRLYLGFAVAAEKADVEVTTLWPFSLGGAWEVRAFWRDLLATDDDWKVGAFENTLAAAFLQEDLRDYHHVYGGGGSLEYWPHRTVGLTVSLATEGYRSIDKQTDFSLFGGDKEFPANPDVFEGRIARASVSAEYDNLDELVFLPDTEGWRFRFSVERADSTLGSDVEYTRYTASAVRLQETYGRQYLRARLAVGTASAAYLPRQRSFVVGGLSTLRGHKERSFVGDRMALLNADYYFGGDLIGRLKVPVLGRLQLVPFCDVGLAWSSNDPFDELNFDGFDRHTARVDVGIGVADAFELVRIDIARRTDTGRDAWRITGRILLGEKMFD
jgi:outer membrane protein assembly factor BamA